MASLYQANIEIDKTLRWISLETEIEQAILHEFHNIKAAEKIFPKSNLINSTKG